ncbi:hypothetical protein GCM10010191_52930 [Actinomadura vinacea]|uniref:Sigma-70 family RNA polymerase sigma factor n=1 Tax=Actinomadura vinacea TaxID=115336 RepID=A0ABN3JKK6_9ACTN
MVAATKKAADRFRLSASDTDDLVGDVLESLYKNPEKVRELADRKALAGYAYTTARNRAYQNLKLATRRNEVPLDVAHRARAEDAGALATRMDVTNVVLGLDARIAAIAFARIFLEMTFPDIAQEFGLSEGTVKSRFREALDELKKVIRHSNDGTGR